MSSPNGDASRTLKNGYTCDCAQRLICRGEKGLIIEIRVYYDVLGLMAQLGP